MKRGMLEREKPCAEDVGPEAASRLLDRRASSRNREGLSETNRRSDSAMETPELSNTVESRQRQRTRVEDPAEEIANHLDGRLEAVVKSRHVGLEDLRREMLG